MLVPDKFIQNCYSFARKRSYVARGTYDYHHGPLKSNSPASYAGQGDQRRLKKYPIFLYVAKTVSQSRNSELSTRKFNL
jgi:hypothetical protein